MAYFNVHDSLCLERETLTYLMTRDVNAGREATMLARSSHVEMRLWERSSDPRAVINGVPPRSALRSHLYQYLDSHCSTTPLGASPNSDIHVFSTPISLSLLNPLRLRFTLSRRGTSTL